MLTISGKTRTGDEPIDFSSKLWENITMDIYLYELQQTIALHEDNCDCRDCAMFYFLTGDDEDDED